MPKKRLTATEVIMKDKEKTKDWDNDSLIDTGDLDGLKSAIKHRDKKSLNEKLDRIERMLKFLICRMPFVTFNDVRIEDAPDISDIIEENQ